MKDKVVKNSGLKAQKIYDLFHKIVEQLQGVSLKYLFKYLDEFCYCYIYRHNAKLIDLTIQKAVGVQYE